MFKTKANILRTLLPGMFMLAFVLAPALPASAQDIASGLVGHWKLDETSGNTIVDSGTGSNNGTWSDGSGNDVAEETGAGQISRALTFDGSNDQVLIDGTAAELQISGDFTVSTWFKSSGGSGSSDIIAKGVATTANYWLMIDDNDVTGGYYNGSDWNELTTSGYNYRDNQWHHAAVTKTGSTVELFVDGVSVGTSSYGSTAQTGTEDVYIGGSSGRKFTGSIDDVRIYNRALTSEAITILAAGIAPGAIRYDETSEAIQYHNGTEWIHAGIGSYSPNAVDFDGSTTLLAGSTLNVQDSKKVTGSVWYKADTDGNFEHILYGRSASCNNCFRILKNNNDSFRINGPNINIRSSISSVTAAGGWNHLVFSFDLSDPTKRHLYVNGVSDLDSVGTYTDSDIPHSEILYAVSAVLDGTGAVTSTNDIGEVADLWVDFGTYIDLSVAANRAKFISANGMPMYHGPDGSLQMGFQPDIFLSGDTADWHTNKGTAGGFTENGTLTDATDQPGGTSSDLSWAQAGSDLNVNMGQPDTAHLDSTTIAFADSTQDDLRTYSWNGSNWSQVGNDLNIPGINAPAVTTINTNTIAMTDRDTATLRTFIWDGTDWTAVGNTLAIAGASGSNTSIDAIDTNLIAYYDEGTDDLRTYSWDGSDWSQVGNDLNIPNLADPEIALIDDNRIAFYGTTGSVSIRGLRTYEWDGTDWAIVGNNNQVNFSKAALVSPKTNKLYVYREDDHELQTFAFDGTDWAQEGTSLSIPQAFSAFTAIGLIDKNTISYVDGANDDFRVYTLSDTSPCASPTAQPGSIIYNTDDKVMQYCNGTDHVAMGPVGGTGGGGCANPVGSAGDIIFNSDYNSMQYCNAEDWVGIGFAVSSSPILNGLIAHWPLDETSGNAIFDAAGNNHGTWDDNTDGIITSEAVTGEVAGALDLEFDDRGDVFVFTDDSLDNLTTMTACAWVRPEGLSGAQRPILGKRGNAPGLGEGWELKINSPGGNLFVFRSRFDDYVTSSSNAAVTSTWTHVCSTWDGTEGTAGLNMYIDGVLDNNLTGTDIDVFDDTAQYVTIGSDPSSSTFFDGYLDDVRLYNRELSAAEILSLYNFGISATNGGAGITGGNGSDPLTNLVSRWTLDETSGSVITDSVGSNNGTWADGTNNDVAEETTTGEIATAIAFDGSNDEVRVSNNASLENFTALTLSAWVYPTGLAQSSGSRVISKSDGGSGDDYNLGYSNGNDAWFRLSTSAGTDNLTGSTNLPLNQWTLITATWDGTTARLYENGVEVDSDSNNGTINASAAELTLGTHADTPGSRRFPGNIDDARIYNRTLNSIEILDMYNTGIAAAP